MNRTYTIDDKQTFPKTSGIYCIQNILNGKTLVGQTSLPFRRRWIIHIKSLLKGTHENPHLQYAFNKYTPTAFRFRVLEEINDNLNDREVWWMKHMASQNPSSGYNIRDGGSHGKMSDDSKRKMSLARRGKCLSEEHKRHLSESLVGNTNALGNVMTDEQKEKIRQSKLGDKNPALRPDVRKKISESAKRRYQNQKNHPRFGKHWSKEHRELLSAKSSKTYSFINPQGIHMVITNLLDFCENNGLDISSMYKLHAGTYRCKTYKGWRRNHFPDSDLI